MIAGEFIMGLTHAALKLRSAADAGEGVTLDAEETRALKEALRLLSASYTSLGNIAEVHGKRE